MFEQRKNNLMMQMTSIVTRRCNIRDNHNFQHFDALFGLGFHLVAFQHTFSCFVEPNQV